MVSSATSRKTLLSWVIPSRLALNVTLAIDGVGPDTIPVPANTIWISPGGELVRTAENPGRRGVTIVTSNTEGSYSREMSSAPRVKLPMLTRTPTVNSFPMVTGGCGIPLSWPRSISPKAGCKLATNVTEALLPEAVAVRMAAS